MNKRQLLFVTYRNGNGHIDEGFSYVIELARAMHEDIVLLKVRKKESIAGKVEDLMAGVAFAEEGEHETARELTTPPASAGGNGAFTEMVLKASKAGVHLSSESTEQDVIAGVRGYVKQNPGVDKVVLSPAVTESEVLTSRDLNRLVRTASRPIVTMTRQSVRAARERRRSEAERAEKPEESPVKR